MNISNGALKTNDNILVLVELANINAAFSKIKPLKSLSADSRLDIAKLVDSLIIGMNVVSKRIYLETRETTDPAKQRRFHDYLRHKDFSIVTKGMKVIRLEDGSTKNKANFDVEITFDTCGYFWRRECNKIVLFSGDSDFAYLIDGLRQLSQSNIDVSVVSSRESVSTELRDRANRVIFLEDLDLNNVLVSQNK